LSAKKILVLGGTGAIGKPLVAVLSQHGYQLTVTSRSRSAQTAQVRYLQGDAHDRRFLAAVLAHEPWSAIIDFMVYTTPTFHTRSRLLLDATDHYLFLSSGRVYAPSSTPLTEASPRLLEVSTDKPFLATDEYALAKARQENILFSATQGNWTVIRPYITFSQERLQLGVLEKEDWLFRALNDRTIVFSRDINQRHTTLTHGVDVAKGIAALVGQQQALGETFHITHPTPVRWSEVLETYCDTLQAYRGVRPKLLLADLNAFITSHPAPYQIKYDRLYDRVFDGQKIARFIETQQFTAPLVSLRSCLETFLVSGQFKTLNGRREALKDAFTHERTPLRQLADPPQKLRYVMTRLIHPFPGRGKPWPPNTPPKKIPRS